jgi:hypothetical protein
MSVVLDIDPTTAHRWAGPVAGDVRIGFTICGVRFVWALPGSSGKAKRCRWCWA